MEELTASLLSMKKEIERITEGKEKGRTTKRTCPRWEGNEGEDYGMWKKLIDLWFLAEGKKIEYPAVEIMLSLGERAFKFVQDISMEDLQSVGGKEAIIKRLDEQYGRERTQDKFDKISKYFKI